MAPTISLVLVTAIVVASYLHLVASRRVDFQQDALIWKPSHASRLEKGHVIRGDSSAEEYGYDYPPAYDFGTSMSATVTNEPQTPSFSSVIPDTTATSGAEGTFRSYTPPAAETTTSQDETTTLLPEQRSHETVDGSWTESASSQTYVLPQSVESKPPQNTSTVASHHLSSSFTSSRPSTELTKDPVSPTALTSTAGIVTVTVTEFVSESRGTSATTNSTFSALASHSTSTRSTYPFTSSGSGISAITPTSWGTGAVSHNYTSTTTGDIPTFTITPPFQTPPVSFQPHSSNSSTTSQDSKQIGTESTIVVYPTSEQFASSSSSSSSPPPYPTNVTQTATVDTGHGQPLPTSRPKYPVTSNATARGTGGSWSASGTEGVHSVTPAQSTIILNETASGYPIGNTTSLVTPSIIITTEVVTITVYPPPMVTTVGSNETTVATRHSSVTSTRTVAAPYTLANSSLSASSVQGTVPFTTGRVDPWGRTSLMPSGGHSSVPCFSGYQNMTNSTGLSSSAMGTGFQPVTSSYPRPSSFKTSVSIIQSTSSDSSVVPTTSETVAPKVLPGNPNFPWVGSGHPNKTSLL